MSAVVHPILMISGDPVAAPRPRVTNRGITYMPKNYTDYKKAAIAQLQQQWTGEPIDKASSVVVQYVFSRPKSTKKSQTQRAPKTTKPDIDNLIKSTLDALVQAGVMKDDNIVTEIRASKYIAGLADDPHTYISIISKK